MAFYAIIYCVTHSPSASADPTTSLRETKKQRTRANIIDAVLTLGSERGLEETTVAAIAAEAEIGLRTFFRFFPSKEEAVVAPEGELFQSLLDSLSNSSPHQTLGTAISHAFEAAMGHPDAPWWDRFRRAAYLLENSPSANASAVLLCTRTREQLHAILRDSLQETREHVIELALEGIMHAWRLARRDWIAAGGTEPTDLQALIRRNIRTLEERPLAGLRYSGTVTDP